MATPPTSVEVDIPSESGRQHTVRGGHRLLPKIGVTGSDLTAFTSESDAEQLLAGSRPVVGNPGKQGIATIRRTGFPFGCLIGSRVGRGVGRWASSPDNRLLGVRSTGPNLEGLPVVGSVESFPWFAPEGCDGIDGVGLGGRVVEFHAIPGGATPGALQPQLYLGL